MHAASTDEFLAYQGMLTGILPSKNILEYNKSIEKVPYTQGEWFQQREYATGACLSSDLLHKSSGIHAGFSTYDDDFSWMRGWSVGIWGRLVPLKNSIRSSSQSTDLLLDWMEQQQHPFMAWLQFSEPQAPYRPPVEWSNHFFEGDPFELDDTTCIEQIAPIHLSTVEGRCSEKWLTAQYKGEIASLDREIGMLIDWVELNPNTMLVLVGAFGVQQADSRPWFGRGEMTTSSTHVPALFWFPSILQGGTEVSSLTSTMDVFPTIFDIFAFSLDASLSGRSQVDAIYGGREERTIYGVSRETLQTYVLKGVKEQWSPKKKTEKR
jgi:arylsulfatase A-like enzyme